ncbi:MAG: glucose-6-phosphate isomerase [Gemmatimonadota bacterium]|nr:MAG: glucose-6-phosphate isomerase [Gemmatimonadota bacterium]
MIIDGKQEIFQPDRKRLSKSLGSYQKSVDSALAEMRKNRTMTRIWTHDHTVWKPESTDITNRLGWLTTAEMMLENLPHLEAFVEEVRTAGYTHTLLLGMGGSSLAPEVFSKTFGGGETNGRSPRQLDFAVLDSTDPGAVKAHAERLDLTRTLFIVSTKSGGTVETLSFFKYFYNLVAEVVGPAEAGECFVAITDPGSHLEELAAEYDFRRTFLNDPNIGGRYSALSYFGLVPAALIGMDVETLLRRALSMAGNSKNSDSSLESDNCGLQLGTVMGELAKAGRDKVTFAISQEIGGFGDWVEQLIAESTGKERTGILPVVHEPLGPPEVYGGDRLFVSMKLSSDNTNDAAMKALEDGGHPAIRIHLDDLYDLGGQFFLWEMATAVAGSLMGINPFDQPDVEASKVLARDTVAEYSKKGAWPPCESAPLTTEALNTFLSQSRPGDYVALQAYVPPTVGTDGALREFRRALRDKYKLATTVGFGPRFLHSTGQLHKGDGGHGLFIQFTADDQCDVPIPDKAGSPESSMTFGLLKAAQALGDRQALLDRGRRVITFHLDHDVEGRLKQLTGALGECANNVILRR